MCVHQFRIYNMDLIAFKCQRCIIILYSSIYICFVLVSTANSLQATSSEHREHWAIISLYVEWNVFDKTSFQVNTNKYVDRNKCKL